MNVKIEHSWKAVLGNAFQTNSFLQLSTIIKAELKQGKTIYPAGSNIFRAFDLTPFDQVKVVILGQDPYHQPNQAEGLSFSVPQGCAVPRSLQNIFKELHTDVGLPLSLHNGHLAHWALQGVLLLNAILTVRQGEPASHTNIGWQTFTNTVIETISNKKQHIVFMLWGKFAQQKIEWIDSTKHFVLKAPHPSPYSADTGFFGCKHFSKANQYLVENNIDPIDWSVQ